MFVLLTNECLWIDLYTSTVCLFDGHITAFVYPLILIPGSIHNNPRNDYEINLLKKKEMLVLSANVSVTIQLSDMKSIH